MSTIFAEIGIAVITASVLAVIARFFRQPPLVAYLITGIVLGPLGAHALNHQEVYGALRQVGTALLLFLVGLELDWSKARREAKAVLAMAAAQLSASFLISYGLVVLFQFSFITGIYLGLALSFSSTIVVVKIISETRELNSLNGRLAVGSLLFQDLLAIAALIAIAGASQASSLGAGTVTLLLLAKTAGLIGLAWVLAQYILPPLFALVAQSTELLFLCSLGWCFAFALGATQFEIPLEIGAFLAGISLAPLPYARDVASRLHSLRDFFVILLFVSLGSAFALPTMQTLPLVILIIIFAVFIKPLVTFAALNRAGYTNRVAFGTALTQSQLSEFSLILCTTGVAYGQLSTSLASSLTVATISSLIISAVLLNVRNQIFSLIRTTIRPLEQTGKERFTAPSPEVLNYHIIIFGYHHMGYHILKRLRELNHEVVVVDFNPDIVKRLRAQDVACLYGDVQDEEILEEVQVAKAHMVISTIPHREETEFLIRHTRRLPHRPILIVTAHSIEDALHYYHLGASYVILPHLLGGEHIGDLIAGRGKHSLEQFMIHRAEEVRLLKDRRHALYYE